MSNLINVNLETYNIVIGACKEQVRERKYRRALSLLVTAYKMLRFARMELKAAHLLIDISDRVHTEAQNIRDEMVDDAIDKIFQE